MQRSKALILIQTRSVLSRPYVLLEVYTALRLGLPLVTLSLDSAAEEHAGGGYDDEDAKAFLGALRERLTPGAVALMDEFLAQQGSSFVELQQELCLKLPNVISIAWSPDGSSNHWRAVLEDVVHKVAQQPEARAAGQTSREASFKQAS